MIATQGGATDDFLQGNAANHFIAGTRHENTALRADLTHNAHIEPQLDALVALLENLGPKAAATQAVAHQAADFAADFAAHQAPHLAPNLAAAQPDRSWHPPAARLLQLLRPGG